MKKYATEQRTLLHAFFEKHRDCQYTVEEIAKHLSGNAISISAIYRNINDLVEEGLAGKFPSTGGRKFLYQYIGNETCSEHLHLKCNQCGQIFHMDDKSMEQLLLAAMKHDAFSIDRKRTVLYGSCKACGI